LTRTADGNTAGMVTYRVLNPKGGVVATEDIESAGEWHFFDEVRAMEAISCLRLGRPGD